MVATVEQNQISYSSLLFLMNLLDVEGEVTLPTSDETGSDQKMTEKAQKLQEWLETNELNLPGIVKHLKNVTLQDLFVLNDKEIELRYFYFYFFYFFFLFFYFFVFLFFFFVFCFFFFANTGRF